MLGKADFIENEIGKWLSSIELPIAFDLQYQSDDSGNINVDIKLPDIADIPKEKATQLASGQVKRKAKTQKELKYDYMCCILGLSAFVASNIFGISPIIDEIIMSGYKLDRDKKTGEKIVNYVYSVKFLRNGFLRVNFENLDIVKFFEQFENRYIANQSYDLKTIEPF